MPMDDRAGGWRRRPRRARMLGAPGWPAAVVALGVAVAASLVPAPVSSAQTPIDADIEVRKTGTPDVAEVGDTVSFTVLVLNNGPDAVAAVQFADQPPAADVTDVSWTCTAAGGVTCPLSGGTGTAPIRLTFAMPAGGTLTVTIVATVTSVPAAGRIANQASANSQDPGFLDSNPANNFSQWAIPVQQPPPTDPPPTDPPPTEPPPTEPPPTDPPPTDPPATDPPPTDPGATATTAPPEVGPATTGPGGSGSGTLPATGGGARLLAVGFLLAGVGLLTAVHATRQRAPRPAPSAPRRPHP